LNKISNIHPLAETITLIMLKSYILVLFD